MMLSVHAVDDDAAPDGRTVGLGVGAALGVSVGVRDGASDGLSVVGGFVVGIEGVRVVGEGVVGAALGLSVSTRVSVYVSVRTHMHHVLRLWSISDYKTAVTQP
jgi:hypothetical protein